MGSLYKYQYDQNGYSSTNAGLSWISSNRTCFSTQRTFGKLWKPQEALPSGNLTRLSIYRYLQLIYPLKMVIFHSFFASIPEGTRITPSHRWKHRRTPGNISGRATDSLDQNLRRECLRRTTRESLGWLGRLPLDLAMTKMVMVFISTKTENVTLLTTSKKLL